MPLRGAPAWRKRPQLPAGQNRVITLQVLMPLRATPEWQKEVSLSWELGWLMPRLRSRPSSGRNRHLGADIHDHVHDLKGGAKKLRAEKHRAENPGQRNVKGEIYQLLCLQACLEEAAGQTPAAFMRFSLDDLKQRGKLQCDFIDFVLVSGRELKEKSKGQTQRD